MSAPHIVLVCLSSLCQKLSDLVEVRRSYNKNNFACFFLDTVYYLNNTLKCQFPTSRPPWRGSPHPLWPLARVTPCCYVENCHCGNTVDIASGVARNL